MDNSRGTGPLTGVGVIDLNGGLAASFCAKILGDLGASVIKVEPLGEGDRLRHAPDSPAGAENATFLWANSSKRSIQVDIAVRRAAKLSTG